MRCTGSHVIAFVSCAASPKINCVGTLRYQEPFVRLSVKSRVVQDVEVGPSFRSCIALSQSALSRQRPGLPTMEERLHTDNKPLTNGKSSRMKLLSPVVRCTESQSQTARLGIAA